MTSVQAKHILQQHFQRSNSGLRQNADIQEVQNEHPALKNKNTGKIFVDDKSTDESII